MTLLRNNSGAAYASVMPTDAELMAALVPSTSLASPKSLTFTWRFLVSRMFSGLMSRWTIAGSWKFRWSIASADWCMYGTSSSFGMPAWPWS